MARFDAIVLGLGAMGSAAVWQLAKRGARVFGVDQYSPPHALGSSHGDTRITRLAIGEGEHYTPLVRRSHEIWRELERETGTALLTQCGELIISSDNNVAATHVENFFEKTVDAARRYDIAHELLDAAQIRSRFPLFRIRDDEYGYFEPEAGFVRPEACIRAQLECAGRNGAEIRRGEKVLAIETGSHGAAIVTPSGRYEGAALIVAAGAWLPELLPDFSRLVRIYRQVLCWFEVEGDPNDFRPGVFPVFIWELPDSHQGIYGIPAIDENGLKIATEQYVCTTRADEVDRDVSSDEIDTIHRELVAPCISRVGSRAMRTGTCLYTVTPDAGFVIDRLRDAPRVIVASCCSGHGFKHSAAIGEVLAGLALGEPAAFDLSPCRLDRFG